MHEIPVLMTEKEFQKEVEKLQESMDREKGLGHDYELRIHFLIGWVTSPGAPIHTPEQLDRIFELAK